MSEITKRILFVLLLVGVFLLSCGVWLCGVYLLMGWCYGWFMAVCAIVATAYAWLCYEVFRQDNEFERHITSADMM